MGPIGATEVLANAGAIPSSQPSMNGLPQGPGDLTANDLDQDPEGRKRKLREAEEETKRARPRTSEYLTGVLRVGSFLTLVLDGSDSSDPRSVRISPRVLSSFLSVDISP